MLGAHTRSALRGDYSRARADFTIEQDGALYSAADQAMWRTLYARQSRGVRDHACREFLDGLKQLDAAGRIPDLRRVSQALYARTRWQLVAVPGFIPDVAFFEHLAARRLPVTVWLREPEEMDYLVEPDMFHDFFGHVPMLFHPVFADYVQRFGQHGLAAARAQALPPMGRLYWFTVEFGLIEAPEGLRAYGSGILSSAGEMPYSLFSPRPLRLRFDLERVMRTAYRIDDFQKTYFVIRSLDELERAAGGELAPLCARLNALPELDAARMVPGDEPLTPAKAMT